MTAAVERIVVQTTAKDKQAILDKAKTLDISVSECDAAHLPTRTAIMKRSGNTG